MASRTGLAAIEAIIDASGTAPAIEALLPAGARHRQLRARTLLTGMMPALDDRRPAYLTEAHAALTSLPEADQARLGVTRHKAWTAIISVVGVLVVLGVIGAIAGSPQPKPTTSAGTISAPTSSSPTPSPTPTASPPPAPLTSTASVTRRHPRTGTKVGVSVVTAPHARNTVIAHFETGDLDKTARADATGWHTFWFPLGSAPPGIRVTVAVRVSAHGQKRSTRVWFTPRQPPPPPAPKAATPPPAPPTGCYPKASSGNCYEPGEFCPHADAGMHGIDGSGNPIICEDNNGLRWEPA